ncbi:MAG: DnaA N-terminal domain-containing protein [Pseudomonadota bacterium]
MLKRHLTGPGAGAMKYDLLTALGVYALCADKHTQRRVLRLITLITARYNWAHDEVTVGRAEMARLWGVTERQVKRELSALKAMGFLKLKRAGARGRVSAYSLDMAAILDTTAHAWANVGPDYAERMRCHTADGASEPAGQGSVIPFPGASCDRRDPVGSVPPAEDAQSLSEWARIRRMLEAEDRALFAAWFATLQREGFVDGRLVLRAPTRFHADYVSTRLSDSLRRAAAKVAPDVKQVEVVV